MWFRKNKKSEDIKVVSKEEPVEIVAPVDDKDAEVAAIALALSLYIQDIHDYERTILTIQKVMRPYSPWSSKIYGLRQTPLRIPGLRTIVKK